MKRFSTPGARANKPQRHQPVNAWRLRTKPSKGSRNSATRRCLLKGGPLDGALVYLSAGVHTLEVAMRSGQRGTYRGAPPDNTPAPKGTLLRRGNRASVFNYLKWSNNE